jgi:hypothetical protein
MKAGLIAAGATALVLGSLVAMLEFARRADARNAEAMCAQLTAHGARAYLIEQPYGSPECVLVERRVTINESGR